MRIDETNVNRMVGPMMKAIQASGAKRIGVVSWDSEDLSREVARILALGFSKQLDKKCAAVFSEGLRGGIEEQDGYAVVTVPELDTGARSDVKGDFALLFIAGALSKPLQSADAHVLVIPSHGVARQACEKIEQLTKSSGLKWLGILLAGESVEDATHA